MDETYILRAFGRANFKHIFGMPSPGPPPTPIPPPTMPDPFGPAAREAVRKAQAGMAGGRSSTILTTAASRAGGTLAGSAFSGTKLGGT